MNRDGVYTSSAHQQRIDYWDGADSCPGNLVVDGIEGKGLYMKNKQLAHVVNLIIYP
jgi:hypothetical protein